MLLFSPFHPQHEFLQIVLKLLHSRHHLSPGNNPRAPRFEGRKMNTNPSGICLGSLQIRQAKYSLFRFLQATDFHPTSEKLQNLSCTASLSASSCSISWKITPIRLASSEVKRANDYLNGNATKIDSNIDSFRWWSGLLCILNRSQ